MLAWQPSLLGLGAPTIDLSFRGARRIGLSQGAWVDHVPRWLEGHGQVFEALRDGTTWQAHQRQMYDRIVDVPRLTASVPEDGPGHPVVAQIAAALSARYGVALDRASLAYYRDGRDSVALHGDMVMRDAWEDAVVATVSVGEPRRFLLKPRAGGPSMGLSLGWGDLLVMGGSCQRTWLHGVPKVARAGPRISIMFRSGRWSAVRRDGGRGSEARRSGA